MPYYWNGNQFVFTPSTFGGYATPQAPQAQSLLSAPPSLMSPVKTDYFQGGDSSVPGMGPPGGQGNQDMGDLSGMMGNIGSHVSNNPGSTLGNIAGTIGSFATGIPGLGYAASSLGRTADINSFNTRAADYNADPMSYMNSFNPFLSIDPTQNEAMAGFGTDPAVLTAAALAAHNNNQANIDAMNMVDPASTGVGQFGDPGFQGQSDPADASLGISLTGAPEGANISAGTDGGGGGGGSKIICSYLHEIGLMDYHTFFEDQKFGAHLKRTDPDVLNGYHLWAGPIVGMMKRYPWAVRVVFRLAMPWARHIASLARGGGGNTWGMILLTIGIPICRWLGKRANDRQNVKSL